MAKRAMPTRKANAKPKDMSSQDHRQAAAMLRARADLHDAKARMHEAKNPPPKGKRPYPY
jgi:hypothetical protein